MSFILILGGISSGKSDFAEQYIMDRWAGPVRYVATARDNPKDEELQQKIAKHRQRRPDHWTVYAGPDPLREAARTPSSWMLLVDGLGMALSQAMEDGANWDDQVDGLLARTGPAVIVSDEVGMGLVPLEAETRRFVDWLGRTNQKVAKRADRVIWVTAGMPVVVKGDAL